MGPIAEPTSPRASVRAARRDPPCAAGRHRAARDQSPATGRKYRSVACGDLDGPSAGALDPRGDTADGQEHQALERLVSLTISGVAAGVQSTG